MSTSSSHVTEQKTRGSITIDFEKDGKQHGHICFSISEDWAAWGQMRLPITVIKNGDGPTILFTGGNHGDEYEGPVAQFKLAHSLTPDQVQGRVIILPCLNYPAVTAGMRTSPIDGGNMNRAFPGDANGTLTEKIAHFVTTELLPLADIVVDMHSGGKTLDFVPSAVIHELPNKDIMEKSLAALQAFAAPVSMVLAEDTTGMLDGAVEEREKIFISTELGGMGTVIAERVQVAERGIHNLLIHFGITQGDLIKPDVDTQLLDTPAENFVRSCDFGIYEPLVDIGHPINKGDIIGQIWDYHDGGTAPKTYASPATGLVYGRHAPGLIRRGDAMALVAVPKS